MSSLSACLPVGLPVCEGGISAFHRHAALLSLQDPIRHKWAAEWSLSPCTVLARVLAVVASQYPAITLHLCDPDRSNRSEL